MINMPDGGSDEIEQVLQHTQQLVDRARTFLQQEGIVEMPTIESLPELRNGTLIRFIREEPAPEINVKKGDIFPVCFDGRSIRGGSIRGSDWSPEQLAGEFRQGWWEIAGQLDQWA